MGYLAIMLIGYLTGLMTLPSPDYIEAIKQSTVSIENAIIQKKPDVKQDIANTRTNTQNLPLTRELNPFSGGKIIDLPRSRAQSKNKQDPRITTINADNFPKADYAGDEISIEIPGNQQEPHLDDKNMIDELSMFSKEKPKKQEPNYKILKPKNPLFPAPNKAYVKQTSLGALPISPVGKKPLWQVYRNETHINPYKKPIAFIIGGLGTDYDLSVEAIKTLPSEVTLGFVPYVNNLQKLINLSREYGHETILEIPMESYDFPRVDAGPLALKISDSPEQYTQKLQTLLGRTTGYSGVMNYLGNKYLANDKTAIRLLQDLKQRGLYFVENKTTRIGIMSEFANQHNIPYGASFNIIDEILSASIINANLDALEKNVLEGTPIIGTSYLSKLTMTELKNRIAEENFKKKTQLIPISAYVESSN